MTQHFIGIDLGSHAVKAIAVKQGFRGGEIVKFDSEPVVQDENGTALDSEIMQAAGRLVSRFDLPDASVYCSLPGESVSIHRISLPLSAAKRAQDVLSFELDELLPYDVEDAVFDFMEIERTQQEVRYLVAAAPKQRVAGLLVNLAQVAIDPSEVSVAPLCYAAYLEEIGVINGPTAVVDLGHQRTNVVIAGDAQLTTRTVLRGGRELSVKLAAAGNAEYAKGAEFKEKDGMTGRIGEVLKDAISMIVREILQTMVGHRANGGAAVTKVLLCGGSSKLAGLTDFLSEAMNVPVEVYRPEVFKGNVQPFEKGLSPENAVLAMCLAGTGVVPKTKRFNFRKDEFTFKGDTEAIRQKISIAVVCFLSIVASWIFSTVAKYVVVSAQAEQVKTQLEDTTERVLGQRTVSRAIIENKMGPGVELKSPLPQKDAYDIVIELSKRIPEAVVHDVDELDIKPKHVKLRGKVNSELNDTGEKVEEEFADLSPTDLIKSKLSEYEECFTTFKIPKVRTVAERQEYTMEIDSTCP